ncbi:probable (S)-N-methylcoclaurine 3'-hydroxylase isozyme 2 [Actinidia eriantha]|uniref:probable (S)-N-methylcoclaurine 3'-hydroxylase isozyme 2 n=1 Tax=Actinidia eriantha TaxID=165200 RepID=UPI002589309D|nr:probable (S)-N-methylcoclaurine 3'-hydroxylase isozyme 2 [Actinidia eriantha]
MALITGETNLFFPLIILFLLYLIISKLIAPKSKRRPPLPPGPSPWPIFGNIFQLGKSLPHIALANLAQAHGPLMMLKLGTRPLIVGSSPAAAREILKTHDQALSGRAVASSLQVKGSKFHNLTLALSDECDDQWKRVRSVYKGELFSSKILDAQTEVRENKIMGLVKYLGSKEGQAVKIKEKVIFAAMNILSHAMLSRDLVDFEGKGMGEGLMENIRKFAELGGTPQWADMYPILSGWDLQCLYKKSMDVFVKACAVWVDLVKERRQSTNDPTARRDFTKALVQSGFSDDHINALLMEIFTGGVESTSATTEWTLTELLRNSEVMQKLRKELAKEITGDTIKESDLSRLPYLQACLKETLRLHPPGPLLLPHRATKTCEVMGYTIPKDSLIMVNMWAIARDPKIWNNPLKFRPERFLSLELDYKGTDFEYIPFGSGRRFCTGQPLATRVLPLIIASLIHHFDWALPGDMDPAQINMSDKLDVTMLKEKPLCLIPKLRRQFIY